MTKLLIPIFAAAMLVVGIVSGSIAGHGYHGYSMKMSEMSEIDNNNDGEISFEEFSAPTTEKLKSGFMMLDSNNDEAISKDEWDEFLKVHGFNQGSEG
jgi:Ca2+-binding EF-hand superfamily protein